MFRNPHMFLLFYDKITDIEIGLSLLFSTYSSYEISSFFCINKPKSPAFGPQVHRIKENVENLNLHQYFKMKSKKRENKKSLDERERVLAGLVSKKKKKTK